MSAVDDVRDWLMLAIDDGRERAGVTSTSDVDVMSGTGLKARLGSAGLVGPPSGARRVCSSSIARARAVRWVFKTNSPSFDSSARREDGFLLRFPDGSGCSSDIVLVPTSMGKYSLDRECTAS